jgi:hypothetical protein
MIGIEEFIKSASSLPRFLRNEIPGGVNGLTFAAKKREEEEES